MMTSRSLFARLALATVPALAACATDPADPLPSDDPTPEQPMPEQPMPEQPMPLASGALDPAFGAGGIQPLDIGAAYAAAVDAQGDKLIACATVIDGAAWVARVFRFDTTGTLDTTFGTNGRVTIGAAGGIGCRDIAVLPSGYIAVSFRDIAGNTNDSTWLGPDGAPLGGGTASGAGLSAKLTAAPWNPDGGAAYGATFNGTLSISLIAPNFAGGVGSDIAVESVQRVFRESSDEMSAVVRITDAGITTWQVVTKTPNGLETLGLGARAKAGTSAADLLADAVRLPDGSWFAVGGVDSGLEVMAARFVHGVSNEVFVEHHATGGPASASAVTLDGADRPIVVGKATDAGKTVFAWQRYEPSSVTLDLGYQIEGLAKAAPPSGHGELVDVVRVNGALYALGSYDVETASPKVALVKIAE